ncbi:hydrogenase expression protein HypE [Siculibacillus lacustris]|uniref:Hydrogenase expression protein HypE n=1 Tax=Siculibacillus lacustris TaxID=1549641 RepID=A0A4Q9VPB9_9HYPH|nr:NADH-quinone oxidoreductase subunit C [Siculibacillus lacustris]TBW37578.1 hydrogenase expression protein HypE [Siculibacillus lacustris]
MSLRSDLIGEAVAIEPQHPWPRIRVDAETWRRAILGIASGQADLAGLWSDGAAVHLALAEHGTGALLVISLACPDGTFPSVGVTHPPAQRPERAIRDLWGLEPEAAPDPRRWLDHGRWGLRHPLGDRAPHDTTPDAYPFLRAEGPPMHQIPVGPVHAGIIEPGHFRFTANGETVVRLEERLGYVHKGIEGLMIGASLDRAARLAARVSGDSTVAFSLAFARAAEAALGVAVPRRAVWLRALMAELERLANHLGDFGAICNDAAFSLMLAQCGILRERVLRAARTTFGHRLMMDRIVPGGAAVDLADPAPLRALIADLRDAFPELIELYDATASLQNRTVSTGVLDRDLARHWAVGGPIGRASGRSFDARRSPGYAPYDELDFTVPVRTEGDVDARIWIRIEEIGVSLGLIEQILDRLPPGPVLRPFDPTVVGRTSGEDEGDSAARSREGIALVEGFRGDVLVWVRVDDDGHIARCHLRDPSVFQWPLLEAVIEGNIVADFPLCNKSFNCSYSGHDL